MHIFVAALNIGHAFAAVTVLFLHVATGSLRPAHIQTSELSIWYTGLVCVRFVLIAIYSDNFRQHTDTHTNRESVYGLF